MNALNNLESSISYHVALQDLKTHHVHWSEPDIIMAMSLLP